LNEPEGAHGGVLDIDMARRFDPHADAALDGRARHHGVEPAPEAGKVGEVLPLPLVEPHPAGDASYGIEAGKVFAIRKREA
jgi:hypothetical protein